MVITIKNVYPESRKVIKDIINSNVVDPKVGTSNSRRRWIYREFPDTTSYDFEGYPIIVIPGVDLSDDLQNLQSTLSNGSLSVTFSVYTEYNDTDARIDDISSEIYYTFRRLRTIKELANHNIFEPTVTSSPFENLDEDGKKLSGRIFLIEFKSTLEDNC